MKDGVFEGKSARWVGICAVLTVALAISHYCVRIFICDRFCIPSDSMSPYLSEGDRIVVEKLTYGARIYRSLDFSFGRPDVFRLPGFGNIRVADVIVFNNPDSGGENAGIWFTMNDVCCKRVLGCPGDRIGAVDGHCWNDRVRGPIGCAEMQEQLRWTFDSIYSWNGCYDVFPELGKRWNIKNWGPVVVPSKGMTILLDSTAVGLYGKAVSYENGTVPWGERYEFTHDWFFVVGDNAANSYDSRFFGFVPDDFVIGATIGKY